MVLEYIEEALNNIKWRVGQHDYYTISCHYIEPVQLMYVIGPRDVLGLGTLLGTSDQLVRLVVLLTGG